MYPQLAQLSQEVPLVVASSLGNISLSKLLHGFQLVSFFFGFPPSTYRMNVGFCGVVSLMEGTVPTVTPLPHQAQHAHWSREKQGYVSTSFIPGSHYAVTVRGCIHISMLNLHTSQHTHTHIHTHPPTHPHPHPHTGVLPGFVHRVQYSCGGGWGVGRVGAVGGMQPQLWNGGSVQ